MGAIEPKLILDKPRPCPQCGADVWDVYGHYCPVCAMIEYLKFRHAIGWPLDAEDKKRLGLA